MIVPYVIDYILDRLAGIMTTLFSGVGHLHEHKK
jgi:hypothetical protein